MKLFKNNQTSKRYLYSIIVILTIITFAHYLTPSSYLWLHDIYRRLYYIPIILSGFIFRRKGALICSIIVSIIYIPHAFTHVYHIDSGQNIEKILEIILYNVIAVIVGNLADRENKARIKQVGVSEQLQNKLDEIKIMEKQLIRAGSLKSLGELTAGLAHEIKNPLASLLGATEIIDDEISQDSQAKPMVNIIQTELKRLNKTLENFLSFARPSIISQSSFNIKELIEHVINLVNNQAQKNNIDIRLANSNVEVAVQADRKLISQVLLNIIINAIQAIDSNGEIAIGVKEIARWNRAFLEISIADSGPGIDESATEGIFNPFVTTKENGTGLGLSISSRIMDQHHGYIDFERVEESTIFRIGIPDSKIQDK